MKEKNEREIKDDRGSDRWLKMLKQGVLVK